MIDWINGIVFSWSIGTSPDSELVNTFLDAAVEPVTYDDKRHIVDSGQGGHYRWPGWLSTVEKSNPSDQFCVKRARLIILTAKVYSEG